jgi:hypothetical protein
VGGGQPCRPAAFEPGSERLAPAGGVKVFARHLADGAEVRLDAQVTSLRTLPERGAGAEAEWEVTLASGERLVAPALALALPAPSAVALLEGMPRTPAAVAAVLPLLALVRTLSCLAVIARYPAAVPGPEWDASFPAGHPVLHSLLNDSSKRGPGARCTLVLQANPRWSREHLDEAPEQWSREVLAQAAALHGEWIAAPELVQAHAWRKARVAEGTELSQPVAVTLDGGARLGLCGDAFHPAGGVEGAWLSGRALAARFHRALESGA